MKKRYEDVINSLEMIKVNLLDPTADYEAVEKINDLITDLESYEVVEGD